MKNALMRFALATSTVLAPGYAAAQEAAPPPTPQQVLERLRETRIISSTAAVAILTQLHEWRSRAELDAFADSLVALVVAGLEDNQRSALSAFVALIGSSSPEDPDGIPYAGAYDALDNIFRRLESSSVLGAMIEVDPRRGKEVVRALLAQHGDDACLAEFALRATPNGDEIARELGVEFGPAHSHYCIVKYHDYQYRDVLAQLREGEAEGAERAVDILTERAEGDPVFVTVVATNLVEMAILDGGASDRARRILAVFKRSARPRHADAKPFAEAYQFVAMIFRSTESQAALESLVEIDAARASEFLTELAQRNEAVACTARAVLAGTADGPRLLRDLEGRGMLTYRCP